MESKHISSHSHACAACKYQRRKCKSDCPLAPYFPSSSSRDFVAVHKLFGVSNIIKTLRSFDSPSAKEAAIKTMIFQAKARAADPVGGCHRMICHLKYQIQVFQNELQIVRQQLQFYKLVASQSPINGQSSGESSSVRGNYYTQQVFDRIPLKVETEERFSQSSGSDGGRDADQLFAILSQSDKSSVTVDLSEDRKPSLGAFDGKFNTFFVDSNTRDNDEVLLEEDDKFYTDTLQQASFLKMITVDE